MGKTIQAISLIMTHRTDDASKLPPIISAAAAAGNVGVSARAVVRKVLDPSRPKLRLGGGPPRQDEQGGSSAAQTEAEAPIEAELPSDPPVEAAQPQDVHADGASSWLHSLLDRWPVMSVTCSMLFPYVRNETPVQDAAATASMLAALQSQKPRQRRGRFSGIRMGVTARLRW